MNSSTKVPPEDGSQLKRSMSPVSPTHRQPCCVDSGWPAPGGALLRLHRVTKVYDGNVIAVDTVGFEMARGEFMLLVGPNQAGKTTLLRLIAAEERPTEGAILFDRFDSRTLERKDIPLLRRKMGRIFPDFRLIDDLDVFDNVALPLRILGRREKRIKRRVPEVLEMVGILGASRRFPPCLSSAEKQKAAVARALAGDPLLLLADDPTMNLDEESADEILALLREINLLGTAVLLATRALRLRDAVVRRTFRMDKGRPVGVKIQSSCRPFLPVALGSSSEGGFDTEDRNGSEKSDCASQI